MAALNYNHLRYFWTVAREGSLTRAAQRLNLSPSALSVQLQKLEAQLGHQLFDRVGRRLVLTEAGRIALDHADSVFEAGEDLVQRLRGRLAAARPVLTVGALPTLSRNFQMAFLGPLLGRAEVALDLRSAGLAELLAGLESHAIDVVLANARAPADPRAGLRHHVIDQQPVGLVGRPRAATLRFPEDLRHERVLLPGRGSGIRSAFDEVMERHGIVPVIAAEVDDAAMLRLLARAGDGLALVPPIVVRDELEAGVLVEHARVPGVTETFYAIVKARRFANPLLAEVLGATPPDVP